MFKKLIASLSAFLVVLSIVLLFGGGDAFGVTPKGTQSKVHLPSIVAHATRTRTPTPTTTPTRTATPRPTATLIPVVTVTPDILPTPHERLCSPRDPNWQGSNPAYPMCSAKDLGWRGESSNLVFRKLGDPGSVLAEWDFYGAKSYELRLEKSTQLTQCASAPDGTGAGGFRVKVPGTGVKWIKLNTLGPGLFKLEMYIEMSDGTVRGRNEIFICITL